MLKLRPKTSIYKLLLSSLSCSLCLQEKDSHEAICNDCLKLLDSEDNQRCYRCAIEIAHGKLCGRCQNQRDYFDASYCIDNYQWPLSSIIKQYKYAKQQILAESLIQLFLNQQSYNQHFKIPDALCFVPLHYRKAWSRGFNQSERLAEGLAQHYQIPCLNLFKRSQAGVVQTQLKARQRQRALASVFTLRKTKQRFPRHIALVDDVMTTASTANVLAQQLKKKGVERVDIWIMARTPAPE